MNKLYYEKISKPFRNKVQLINLINKLLTSLGYISYPILLITTYFYQKELLLKCIIIPGSGFILLTVIRKLINRKRPYEALDIDPLIKKDTKGNSMPSRHVFSMSIIALSWLQVMPIVGIILIVCSILIACTRVIGGVHYISDVIAAILCATVWAMLF